MSDIYSEVVSLFDTQDQFVSSYTYDVVAVVDPNSGTQVFTGAEIMKANVGPTSKLMDHPIESGSLVTDFKIIMPVTIELALLVNSQSFDGTYAEVKAAFLASTFLTVRTNADTYMNMVIEAIPHDEIPEMFGMLAIALRLREVQLVTVQYQALQSTDVENPTDQSTVNSGEQQPQNDNSAAYDLAKGVGLMGQ
jgi:hypothetical protein